MISLSFYLAEKEKRLRGVSPARQTCAICRKPLVTCYCESVRPFWSLPQFVILIHRSEVRRSVATGRMAHLCLKNSRLIEGTDFTDHEELNAILSDPDNFCVVLSPGKDALNLSPLTNKKRAHVFPKGKKPVIIVIDGTWAQARRMKRLSTNLHSLPKICFQPRERSKFYVRKQPMPHYVSTIEAIHEVIELCGWAEGNAHATLLESFSKMVSQQVAYEMKQGVPRGMRAVRGQRLRVSPPQGQQGE